jgi:hypothetical protein
MHPSGTVRTLAVTLCSIFLLVCLLLLPHTPVALAAGPDLTIGSVTVQAGQDAVIPVSFTDNGSNITSTAFWIDYDETCLAFDGTDSDSDGIPDAISFNLSSSFSGSVSFDSAHTDSELRFVIYDYSMPLAVLPDGDLLSITFATTCTPAAGNSTTAPVVFSTAQAPSFGDTSAVDVPGNPTDGAVTINGASAGATLTIPHETGDQGTTVQIPVEASDLNGLLGAEVTVTFDGTVIQAQGASVATLATGCSISDNHTTAGQIKVALACATGISSDGTLLWLTFDVVGTPGSSTPLTLSGVSLNDGALAASTTDGSLTVTASYTITGQVSYWNAGTAVANTELTLSGDQSATFLSDATGSYAFTLDPGTYTITPGKSDGLDGTAITAYDTSLVLQHVVDTITLSGYAAQAADVNKTGTITPMDAAYILQKSVNLITLPFPGASAIWEFSPTERQYSPLNGDQTAQDFIAILLGDVSGNWNGSGPMSPGQAVIQAAAPTVYVEQFAADAQGNASASIQWQATDAGLYGLDLVLYYDPAQISAITLEPGDLAAGRSINHNVSEPGVIRIGVAGTQPITESGEVIVLHYQQAGDSPLSLQGTALMNEQPVTVTTGMAELTGDTHIYLPLVRR